MGTHCERHYFDRAIDVCGWCGAGHCKDCLVYPFGRNKLPYCMSCAVEAAGLRPGSTGRPPSRRRRKELEAQRQQLRPAV